jgi:hypothetical protein
MSKGNDYKIIVENEQESNIKFSEEEENEMEDKGQAELYFSDEEEKNEENIVQRNNNERRDSKINPNENSPKIPKIKGREDLEKIKIRKTQATVFEKYLNDTGIASAFQTILGELITKNINISDYYSYTASRLKQFGRQSEELKAKSDINTINFQKIKKK